VNPRRGIAGPPPPPSWTTTTNSTSNSTTTSHDKTKSGTTTTARLARRIDSIDKRRILVQPLFLINENGRLLVEQEREREEAARKQLDDNVVVVDSLFNIAGRSISQQFAVSTSPQLDLLVEQLNYCLPIYLKLRLLNQVFADWKNEFNLSDFGAKVLLDVEHDEEEEDDEKDEKENELTEEEEAEDWEERSLNRTLRGVEEFSIPLSAALTLLNLSFSSINLKTLRQILLKPTLSNSTTASPSLMKFLPIFPNLSTLILISVKNVSLLHKDFYSLLSNLMISLRTLSLNGNSLLLENGEENENEIEESPCLFLHRLTISTPLLRQIDLSFMTLYPLTTNSTTTGEEEEEEFEMIKQVKNRVDWGVRWLDLKVIGLRRRQRRRKQPTGSSSIESDRKEIQNLVIEKRKRGKWLDVII
jgi:hypothetical protein